jgi:hypothetical protein
MITPLQQTPLPLDPMRQQITPAPPIAPPPPPRQPDTPLQATDSSQDKFDSKSGDGSSDQRDAERLDQQRTSSEGKLRSAYLRLHELQREVSSALASGSASLAKALAAEATEVAQSIPANVGVIQVSAQESTQQMPPDDTTTLSLSASFDIARDGLGTARDVVESAASIPYHPVADRIAINAMRQQVLEAMAGVEHIAAMAAAAQTGASAEAVPRLDVKA